MAQNAGIDPAGAAAGVVAGGLGVIANALAGLLDGVGHLEQFGVNEVGVVEGAGDVAFKDLLAALKATLANAQQQASAAASSVAGGVPKIGG
jgi:hypothetical protein